MNKKDIFSLFIIILSLFSIYYPSVVFDFLYSDDYLLFFPKITDTRYDNYLSSSASSLWDYSINIGRPFLYYFILAGNKFIATVGDAAVFRMFALAGLTIFSILTYLWLRTNGRSALNTFFIVILIISLPSCLLSISWITMHIAIYSMVLAVIAIFLVDKGLNSKAWIYHISAFFIMFISLNGYTPYAMIYWCFVLIKVTNMRSLDINDYKLKLFPFFIVGLSSMAVYFIMGKLIFEFGGSVVRNPIRKIYWLVTEPIPYALSFNTLFPNLLFVAFSFFIIFYGVFQRYILVYREQGYLKFNNLLMKIESLKISLILGLLFLSFSPIILANYYTNSHRVLLALKSALIIMFFYGLEEIIKNSKLKLNIVPLILVITAPTVIYYGHYINKNYIVVPQHKEYLYLKNKLDLNLTEDINYIHMYRPNWWTGDVPYVIPEGFDIGEFSSSVSSNAKNMVVAALYDLRKRDQGLDKGELFNKQYIISSSVRNSQKKGIRDNLGESVPEHSVLIVDMYKYSMDTHTDNNIKVE